LNVTKEEGTTGRDLLVTSPAEIIAFDVLVRYLLLQVSFYFQCYIFEWYKEILFALPARRMRERR